MMRRLRRLPALSALALLMALFTLVGTAAPAAAEYRTAYNVNATYLADYPNRYMKATCFSRVLDLAAGWYGWGSVLTEQHVWKKNIELAKGRYTWRDCVYPKDGWYEHEVRLDPVNPSHNYAYIYGGYNVSKDGYYTWGSFLDPHF